MGGFSSGLVLNLALVFSLGMLSSFIKIYIYTFFFVDFVSYCKFYFYIC